MKQRKKMILLISIIIIILIGLVGIAYAYSYLTTGSNQQLVLGDIYMHYTETNELTLENIMPSESYDTNNYFEFTINGKNTYNKDIYYEIVLNHGDDHATRTERIQDNLLKFTLVEIKDNTETIVVDGASYEEINSTRIWVNTISKNTTSDVNLTYRLYMWVSSETTICGGEATGCEYDMDTWNTQVYASIKVNVNGDFSVKESESFSEEFKEYILTTRTNSYIEEDGTIYLSGSLDDYNSETTDDIDFNYVWYSGKLWRITSINPDGTMKLITENIMTGISFGLDLNFYTDENNTSYMYQWLNEDFLDTLYNYENIIVTDYLWNASQHDLYLYAKPEETNMVKSKVGMLTFYEYLKSSEILGNDGVMPEYMEKSFLNIDSWWYTLTPQEEKYLFTIEESGSEGGFSPLYPSGVRPCIILQSNIEIDSGDGSYNNPYRLKGDKENIITNTTYLNTRTIGEYVNFDNNIYRIVNINNEAIKINSVDAVNKTLRGAFLNVIYGTGTSYYADYELNNTWYNSITSNYKSMLIEDTYYLGTVTLGETYKNAICDVSDNFRTIKECQKTSSTWTGYVGLARFGEIFSISEEMHSEVWLITPATSSNLWSERSGYMDENADLFSTYYLRPSITLNSSVKITGGNGTKQSPFEISL